MNTTIFDNAVGMPVPKIIESIPAEWHKVYNNEYIYVYRHNTVEAVALFACNDDQIVRTCDVKRKRDGKFESIYLHTGLFENLDSYRDIKADEDIVKRLEKNHGVSFPVCFQLERKLAVRRFYQRVNNRPEYNSVPLRNNKKEWRTVSDEPDSRTDFIIIPDIWGDLWETEEGYAQINEDIEELVFSTVGYRSMYDFPTGHIVTYTWGFKRVPCGVAVVHTCGIDW